jgi:CBS domain containing-hemolysin-like protein
MIPLRDTVMIEESADPEEIVEIVKKTRFSRIPVYRKSRANIVGVLNVFDMFYESGAQSLCDGEDKEAGGGIKHLIRPLPSVSRSARIDETLVVLREARQPMGLVVGPHKEAVGIVTVKDLLEEITGEIGAW